MLRRSAVVLAACLVLATGCGGSGSSVASRVTYGGNSSAKATIDADQIFDVTADVTPSASVSYALSGPGTLYLQHTIVGDREIYTPPLNLATTVTATITATVGSSTATGVLTINPAIVFASQTLPAFSAGRAYSATVVATLGTGNLSFAVNSGSLPTGIALSSSGVLSGTPTTMGSYTFTIQVTDQADTPVRKTQSFAVTVS